MVQAGIQSGQNVTSFRKHKVFLLRNNTFSNLTKRTSFLMDGKVREINKGINEHIDTCEIEFPAKAFGNHIGFNTPVIVAIDNASNIVFRGNLVIEKGILSRTSDTLTTTAYGLKWYLNKMSKIRGKIYTVDNTIKPILGYDTNTTNRLFEKFRNPPPGANTAYGYLGSERTVFNVDGKEDSATSGDNKDLAIAFKFDPTQQYIEAAGAVAMDVKYFWNYATILMYIEEWYIKPFLNTFLSGVKVRISQRSFEKIFRWGEKIGLEKIRPINFDINGLGPVEAIDKVVKAIPGPWYWYLKHSKNVSEVELINHLMKDDVPKAVYIGRDGKILDTDSGTNIAGADVERSIADAIVHAVVVGAPLKLETTLELIPRWTRYLRPTSDQNKQPSDTDNNYTEYEAGEVTSRRYISHFKNPIDYKKYVAMNKAGATPEVWNTTQTEDKAKITASDVQRYARIFREFTVPGSKEEITKNLVDDLGLHDDISDVFSGFASEIEQFIFDNAERIRKIEPPVTKYETSKVNKNLEPSRPFIFLYDESKTIEAEDEKPAAAVGGADKKEDILKKIPFIIPDGRDKDAFKGTYSFENDFQVVKFSKPQYSSDLPDVLNADLEGWKKFANAKTKRAFMTCRISLDVPLIDDLLNEERELLYGNGRFIAYYIDEKLEFVLRSSAIYPKPKALTTGVPAITYTLPSGTSQIGSLVIPTKNRNLNDKFPLLDWNMLNSTEDGLLGELFSQQVVKSDLKQLKQALEDMLTSAPDFIENISLDHGRVDLSLEIGDQVDRIIGSELSDGADGYYGLDSVVTGINITSRGDTEAWKTLSVLRNRRGFTLGDLKIKARA